MAETPKEREQRRVINHTLFCFDHDCPECLKYEHALEDGPQHFPEDPRLRIAHLDDVIKRLISHAERIGQALEVSPVAPSMRRAVFELEGMAHDAHSALTGPLSRRAREARKAKQNEPQRTPLTLLRTL